MMTQGTQLHVDELYSGVRQLQIEGCTGDVQVKNLCIGVSQLYLDDQQ